MKAAAGRVSFVSVGYGEPALSSQRAAARIAGADVVVPDEDRRPPTELIALARAGQQVVRVVAGDALESPTVMQEALAVARAGVAIEIVPGVGARAAAAAFAGVVGNASSVNVDQVAKAVAREPRDAVVTLVARVGQSRQRVVVTTALEATESARGMGATGERNILVAIGAPVDELRWFERRPLFGKRVLVTRAREQAGSTAAILAEVGAEALVVPTITIEPSPDPSILPRAIADLGAGRYDWAAFTSANGVERTWEALEKFGADARLFGSVRLAAVGLATSQALARHGLRADVMAREFRGEGLADAMLAAMKARGGATSEAAGPRVLLARAARARDALPDALRAAGCTVDIVAAYETRPAPVAAIAALANDFENGSVDAVMFTSSSTVESLCDALGERAVSLLRQARVASIGPVTSDTLRSRGLKVDVQAPESTVMGLIRALAESYAETVA